MALLSLLPELRASLAQLEALGGAAPRSPLAELRLACALRTQAALLGAVAARLEERAHESLGRLGAEAVGRAAHAATPEGAAEQVADVFLALAGGSGLSP